MRVRGLDALGDWLFGRGLQSYKIDLEALKQSILTRLSQWKGDCFFAVNEGVDWNNYLDIGTKLLLDSDVKRVILQTGGVLRMNTFASTLNVDSRELTIQCSLLTIYGELNISEAV